MALNLGIFLTFAPQGPSAKPLSFSLCLNLMILYAHTHTHIYIYMIIDIIITIIIIINVYIYICMNTSVALVSHAAAVVARRSASYITLRAFVTYLLSSPAAFRAKSYP